jgi:hypothetical protein
VDLEELEVVLVDVLAIAVARRHVGGGPPMVGTVPALLTGATLTLVVPVESYIGAGWGISGVRGRRSVGMSYEGC